MKQPERENYDEDDAAEVKWARARANTHIKTIRATMYTCTCSVVAKNI